MANEVQLSAEEQEIRAKGLIAAVTLPAGVTAIDVHLGPNHYGEASLWLQVQVRGELHPDRSEIERLTRFTTDLQDLVFRSGITLFPYTTLEQAA